MGITFNFGQSESSKKESGNESVDLEAIKKNLLNAEVSKSSKISNTLPNICLDTSAPHNFSNFVSETTKTKTVMLFTQDKEILQISEELENNATANFTGCQNNCNTEAFRMKGYFCSDTVLNLDHKVFSEYETKVLEKGLDFPLIQKKVNEPEVRQDFENFAYARELSGIFEIAI